ncbi:MAG: hypothetical protein KDD84_17285 [Caldilineaceae bacterium]|nr:hypothetical protein [Caldilineaceae bacterium]
MLKRLRGEWQKISRYRSNDTRASVPRIRFADVRRTLTASNTLRGRIQVLLGWLLIGLGVIGVVMPVIPGAFLLVIGAALAGWRHPFVEKMAEPMFRVSEALPEDKIPARLRPLWAAWRRLDRRGVSERER